MTDTQITFSVKKFHELVLDELYEILYLRSKIFVVEQECVYLDIDNKDKVAFHVLGKKDGKIVAYSRLFKEGDCYEEASIGRVIVMKEERKYGYGHELIKYSKTVIKEKFKSKKIKIGAQLYLKKFYETHGFRQIGEKYIEDGIPHIYMLKLFHD